MQSSVVLISGSIEFPPTVLNTVSWVKVLFVAEASGRLVEEAIHHVQIILHNEPATQIVAIPERKLGNADFFEVSAATRADPTAGLECVPDMEMPFTQRST